MKTKVLNAMWKKAYNRLNRTREWAANSNYSTFPSIHRTATEIDVPSPAYVKNANNTSDIRNLGRETQHDVHPLIRESAVARLLVEGRLPPSSAPISIPRQDAVRSRTDSESQYSDPGYSGSPSSATPVEALGMELGNDIAVTPRTFHGRKETDDAAKLHDENIKYLEETILQEITFLKDVARVKACGAQSWKCAVCPQTEQTSARLLSHYQFHLQLLTNPSSRAAHLEYLTAYRHGKQNTPPGVSLYSTADKVFYSALEGARVTYSQGNGFFATSVAQQNAADANTFRRLLSAQKQRQQQLKQQQQQEDDSASNGNATSYSNVLRRLVQTVMQKSEEKGEQASASSITIYESLINSSKVDTKAESNTDCCPAKKPKMDEATEETAKPLVTAETLRSSGDIANKEIWDYPIDMSVSKCSVKQEPMELSVPAECSSYNADIPSDECNSFGSSASGSVSSDRLSYASPEEITLESPGQESGVFDMSSPSLKESDIEPANTVQERKRTFDSTQQSPVRKCNGSFAPRKMLIARSRRTHRSSSMESLSSLDSTSYAGSMPPKTITTVGGMQMSDCYSDVEPSTTPLPYPIQNNLALDMSTQCSLLLPIDSLPEDDSDSSRTSSPSQGVVNSRELGGPINTQCMYCNIQFGDEVLHSIHMGCHNHTKPFVCNMCGKDCGNKYGFATHIQRGHNS